MRFIEAFLKAFAKVCGYGFLIFLCYGLLLVTEGSELDRVFYGKNLITTSFSFGVLAVIAVCLVFMIWLAKTENRPEDD